MKLYTYWRSLATFRVRIALNLKGVKYEAVYVDLDAGHLAARKRRFEHVGQACGGDADEHQFVAED